MGKKNTEKNPKTADKKAAVLKDEPKGGGGRALKAAFAVIVLASIAAAVILSGGKGFKTVTAEAGLVKLPISDISDGKARHYTYRGSEGNINFFVIKSSDGVLRAAFDACDVCYREKKGYGQEGDSLVCRNCGQRFPSESINVLRGGCNPAPLERQVMGGHLVIKAADIEAGGLYFR